MPNPLIGSVRLNTGKRADERGHHVDPHPEAYLGNNNPYRGTNDHGVPVHSHAADADVLDDIFDDTTSGEYEPAKPPLTPVPVEVVKRYSRELRRFNTRQAVVPGGGVVVALVGRNSARSRVTVKVLDAGPIYLGDTESVNAANTGWPLGGPAEKILEAEDAVFACQPVAAVNPIIVYILEEFVVQEI